MLQVKVNDKYNFGIDKNNDELLINGEVVNADIKQLNNSAYHIINQLKSYNAEV